jgi:hypothetical protein
MMAFNSVALAHRASAQSMEDLRNSSADARLNRPTKSQSEAFFTPLLPGGLHGLQGLQKTAVFPSFTLMRTSSFLVPKNTSRSAHGKRSVNRRS